MAMQISSPAFDNNGFIPERFTGEGDDISPPLQWSGVPEHTVALALICDDPDAPNRPDPFVHWVLYNMDPKTRSLPSEIPQEEHLKEPVRADQGRNSFLKIGYGGPMPPVGHGVHHYNFKLYALSGELFLTPGATKEELLKAMQGKILDAAQLIGRYERREAKQSA